MHRIIFNKKLFLKHLINWIVLGFFFLFLFPINQGFDFGIELLILRLLIFILIYYAISLFAIRFYIQQRLILFSFITFALYILFLSLLYFIDEKLILLIIFDKLDTVINYRSVANITIFFVMLVLMAFSFYRNNETVKMISEQTLLEQFNTRREIAFLRNQFNHHISFNFLNYCYSKVGSNEISGNIISTYSDMLRYTLDAKPALPLPLTGEIKYIEQFIFLQEQLGKNVSVQFIATGQIERILILPCILITFVENAFKYGIINNPEKPIRITLDCHLNYLNFLVENFKFNQRIHRLQSTGTGQLNAKAHLDLYYQNKYQLKIDENEKKYRIHLKIEL